MTNRLVATVQGSAAQPYEIRETEDPAVLWCSCPAWRNNKAQPKTCKHIKGLQPGAEAAPTPAAAPTKRVSGALSTSPGKPMRLESTTTRDAQAFLESDEWVAEQKVDGTRVIIRVSPDGVSFTASNGEPLKHSASLIHVKRLTANLPVTDLPYTLDGELLWTGHLWAFDMLHSGTEDITSQPLRARRAALELLFAALPFGPTVHLLPQARTLEDKVALLKSVHTQGGEGLVLKRLDKPYELGRRVVHQLKLKFTQTVDCVVAARNTRGHENAELEVFELCCDGGCEQCEGGWRKVNIGSCSMIGKPNAQVGDVVEVRYLYASEDLRLYQPTLLRIRTDKAAEECLLDQLRPVNKEVVC